MGSTALAAEITTPTLSQADQQHKAWLARSFGRPEYSPLNSQDLGVLVSVGELVPKYSGSHLYREDDAASAVFVIESGEVELYRGSGATRRVLSRVGPGSILGDMALFGGTPHLSSAQAVTRVRVFRLERDRLLGELARNPAVCLRWLVAGMRRLEATQRRVLGLMHKTVLGQVADLLVEEADSRGDINLSQTTLATLLGVSRQSVNEALSRLRDQGAVETGYRHIRVLDRDKLTRISES